MENEAENNVKGKQKRKKHELTNSERTAVLQALLERSKDRQLERGAIKYVATIFGVGRNTVGRIWSRALESSSDISVPMNVSNRKHLTGRKKKDYSSQLEELSSIPLQKLGTLRAIAEACGIPKTTLISRMKDGEIRRHSKNAVKPFLIAENTCQKKRLKETMLRAKYQSELDKLKVEEKYMKLISSHLKEQINRLKMEEMALKNQISIQEEKASSVKKEPMSEKSDDEDVNINAVPLNLGVNYMHNDDDDEENEEEEDDDDDDDDEDMAEEMHLSNYLDQLAKQQKQQEKEEYKDDS